MVQQVLLGYEDGQIIEEEDACTSKVGGQPTFFNDDRPIDDFVICSCGKHMYLLTQAYAPLENSTFDRTLYLFGCNDAKCRRYTALRSLSLNAEYAKKQDVHQASKPSETAKPKADLGSMLFGATSWGDDDDEEDNNDEYSEIHGDSKDNGDPESDVKELQTATSKLTISSKKTFPSLPSFQASYLYITAEELPSSKEVKSSSKQLDTSTWSGEGYEKQNLPGYGSDRAFRHFLERVSHHPSQLIRYDHCGTPLFYTDSKNDKTATLLLRGKDYDPGRIPPCDCGSVRVFEMQLMPALLSVLGVGQGAEILTDPSSSKGQNAQPPETSGMDFGTLLVFTCLANCGGHTEGVTFKEELVLAQFE